MLQIVYRRRVAFSHKAPPSITGFRSGRAPDTDTAMFRPARDRILLLKPSQREIPLLTTCPPQRMGAFHGIPLFAEEKPIRLLSTRGHGKALRWTRRSHSGSKLMALASTDNVVGATNRSMRNLLVGACP